VQKRIERFLTDTSGAVTVDWTALTGVVLALVIAFFAYFNTEMGHILHDLIAKIISHL
jgi:hypothetical protein